MRKFNRKSNDGSMERSSLSLDLASRPYRTLNRAKSITVPISPYEQNTNSPVPYKVVTGANRVMDGYYPGKMNMSGNILDILPSSTTSALIKNIDAMHMELKLKYMYLALDGNDINKAANKQFGKSINEALAKVSSDAYTELPFFKDTWTSPTVVGGQAGMPDTDSNGYGEVLVWYQSMLQNTALPITTYAHLLAMEPYMLQMAYNRESHVITELMGLFKKAAFKNYIKTFNTIIKGNYFDLAWFKQLDTLANGVARKANDIRHPLLTLTCTMQTPNILGTVDISGTTKTVLNWENYKVNGKRFEDAVNDLCSMMNPYEVIKWARCVVNPDITPTYSNARAYFDHVVFEIEAILGVLASFQKDTADIRTMLDVAKRGDLNRWVMGIFFDTEGSEEVHYNKIIADIYRSFMATSYDLSWDTKTQSWTFKTPWDDTFGFPEYDQFNGGSFLTFSNHPLHLAPGETGLEQKYLIPVLYRIDTASSKVPMTMIDRDGIEYELHRIGTNPNNNEFLCRLNLLQNSAFNVCELPVVNITDAQWSSFTNLQKSQVLYILEEVFGFGGITKHTATTLKPEPDDTDIQAMTCNSDLIGFVDIQLSDVSNDLMVYYQTYSPLKVYTDDSGKTIGFAERHATSFYPI